MSTPSRSQRRRLSNILVDQGIVSKEDVQEALHIQSTTGEALGAILVDMECLTPDDVAKVICVHYQLPFIGLTNYEFDSKLVQLFSAEFLHQHIILPFDRVGQMLLCAIMEIPNEKAIAEIPRITKHKVALFVAYKQDIDRLLQEHCPLADDSELLKRRKHIRPPKPKPAEKEGDGKKVFEAQGQESLMEALDSTWDSIFDAVENQNTPEKKPE